MHMNNAPIKVIVQPLTPAEIEQRIVARTAARAAKNWKESDSIRDELAAMGVILKDGKDADGKPVTTWEIAR
jgi:cysteinyl-tRNA synthetase